MVRENCKSRWCELCSQMNSNYEMYLPHNWDLQFSRCQWMARQVAEKDATTSGHRSAHCNTTAGIHLCVLGGVSSVPSGLITLLCVSEIDQRTTNRVEQPSGIHYTRCGVFYC